MSTPPSPAPIQPTAPDQGAPGTPQAGQPTPAEPVQTPPTPPATTPEPTPAPTPAPAEPRDRTPKLDGAFDPERALKAIGKLREETGSLKDTLAAERQAREAAEQKAAHQQQELVQKFADLFGVKTGEDRPPTPEELAAQVTAAQSETKASRDQARQTAVQLAVYRTAGQHGGNPDALLDSHTFRTAVKGLDPTAANFGDDVQAAVKKAVEANPLLAAKAPEPTPAPTPKGGAPMDGAPGGKRQLGAADVARMTPEQIAKAVEEGRLNSYLGSG